MFGFRKNRKNECPIPEDTRIWMENAFLWLMTEFGEEKIRGVLTLRPIAEDFPISLDGSQEMCYNILKVVANQMNVDPNNISLNFFNEQLLEIRGSMGFTIYGQQYDGEGYSSGRYQGKVGKNKYNIAIESGQLKDPEKVIATLAHEISHIKILGEGRLKENDEYLTDLVTVFFGLGIFNANTAFKFYADSEKWSYSRQGYLTQQEWGYALALYAHIRAETKPDWIKYLVPNIQSDYKKSEQYINNNLDKILA